MLEKDLGGELRMLKVEENNKKIIIFLIGFTLISYFLGYFLDENSAGGGQGDFGNTWKNLTLFKSNELFEALRLTATSDSNIFQSSRIPGVYVFHKIFNPFTNNVDQFRNSVFIFSILIPISLFISLKLKFRNINKLYLIFISSLVFLSPYFRTSAYWGNEENFGILALVISYICFQLYMKEKKFKKEFIYINLLAFFSSCCIYFDQKLTFVPAISLLVILFSNKSAFLKFYLVLIYGLYAIPVLYLFNLWGGIMPSGDATSRGILQGSFYPQHFGYSITIISFYLLPFILTTKEQINKKFIIKIFNKKNRFLYSLIFIYIIYFLFIYNIDNEILLGKGVFYKLAIFSFENLVYQKIFLSLVIILGAFLIIDFIKKDQEKSFIILFLSLSSIIYWPVLQEYFDPLIFIIIFTYFNYNFYFKIKNLLFLYFYFFLFLCMSNLYYLFMLPQLN